MANYAKELMNDLPEQFKGRERIEALLGVIGRQLDDLAQFYDDLNTKRTLSAAEGVQLDRIGSILGLNRAEAGALITDEDTVLDDETYRYILGYKIMLNMGQSTYYDIVRGIRQFYNIYPITYYESPDEPAAFTLELDVTAGNSVLLRNILPVKAAGVLTYYQFGLSANSIEVSEELGEYTYTPPYCGTLLCGTYPSTATIGNTRTTEIESELTADGYAFEAEYCGTIPDTATLGRTEETGIESEIEVGTYSDTPSATGELLTGTHPDTATLGNTSTTEVESDLETEGYGYDPEYCGTTPDTATDGYSDTIEVELSSSDVENNAAEPVLCGTTYCGNSES